MIRIANGYYKYLFFYPQDIINANICMIVIFMMIEGKPFIYKSSNYDIDCNNYSLISNQISQD